MVGNSPRCSTTAIGQALIAFFGPKALSCRSRATDGQRTRHRVHIILVWSPRFGKLSQYTHTARADGTASKKVTPGDQPTLEINQENASWQKKNRTADAGHARADRLDQQRNGADCTRRVPMADVLHPGDDWLPTVARPCGSGIFAALLLCLATAVSYAEISKLYPGTGSSYYYAEQALLSKDTSFKYARVSKFIVGWGSHLYYWVYPGVMVASRASSSVTSWDSCIPRS